MTRTYNKTFYTYTHINIQSTYGQITTDPEKRKKKVSKVENWLYQHSLHHFSLFE